MPSCLVRIRQRRPRERLGKEKVSHRFGLLSYALPQVLVQKLVAEVGDDLFRVVLGVPAGEIEYDRDGGPSSRIYDYRRPVREFIRRPFYGLDTVYGRVERKGITFR